jgi:hypothetical protein
MVFPTQLEATFHEVLVLPLHVIFAAIINPLNNKRNNDNNALSHAFGWP